MIEVVTEQNFDDFISNSVAVLKFGSKWCQPCKQITPILDELSDEFKGQVEFGDIDVEQQTELSVRFNIRSIPSIMVFKNGEFLESINGRTKNNIKERLNTVLDLN